MKRHWDSDNFFEILIHPKYHLVVKNHSHLGYHHHHVYINSYLQDLPHLEAQWTLPAVSSSRTQHSCCQWLPRFPSFSPAYSQGRSQSQQWSQKLHLFLPLSTDHWQLQASDHFVKLEQIGARFQSNLNLKSFAWKKTFNNRPPACIDVVSDCDGNVKIKSDICSCD